MTGIMQFVGTLMILIGISIELGWRYGVPVGFMSIGLFVAFMGFLIEALELRKPKEVSNGTPTSDASRGDDASRYTSSSTISSG